jgi:mannosylglycerate hydrolase
MDRRRISIVPHTHWDREWYAPFQRFRMDLVETVDSLLDLLEADPSYRHFMLDGQMAVVDDYLEVRGDQRGRLERLARQGRLSVGPWYILMDEFLVSAETMVRNLQLGLEKAEAFGGAMEVGYLPDMFGHVAQMPQLLSQAGFADAVLWRGVPSSVSKTGFDWVAPDGSAVRVEYLPVGYGNGASLPEDPASLERRLRDHLVELDSFLFDDLLVMNGSDHLRPQPFLGAAVAAINASQEDLDLVVTTLPEHLARAPRSDLERVEGELRSGWRANVLMGVASNRVDVKRSALATERELERRAEPLAALALPPDAYPTGFLDLAWLEVIRNSAHDSICACSVDEVVDAVLHRYDEARTIAEGVTERARSALAASMAAPGVFVLNESPRTRGGLVEAVVAGDELDDERVQVLSERAGLPGKVVLDATTVKTVLGMLQGPKVDHDLWVDHVEVAEDDDDIHVTIRLGAEENPEVGFGQAKGALFTKLGARPDAQVFVELDQPRIRRVLALVESVPGWGWAPLSPAPVAHPARAEGTTLSNGLVEVVIDEADGTFALDGLAGFGRLVDGGDLGDSYNYSPPAHDELIDAPLSVEVEILESGPVRATARILARYAWPERVEGGGQRRQGRTEVDVTTLVRLHAGDPVVRVETSFANPARDHRLRVHLSLPSPTTSSTAECAFGTVVRGLEAEGRPDELGLPTFPSRRFVQAGGLTVVHDGLTEYELVDVEDGQAHALALTVLRSTGMLSRLGMAYRPLPAGPLTAVEGLQLVGQQIVARYALDASGSDPFELADDVLLPLVALPSLGGGTRPATGRLLEVAGAEVSSLHRRDGSLVLRVFNPADAPTRVELPGRRGRLVDLRGDEVGRFEDAFELGPRRFATAAIEESPA